MKKLRIVYPNGLNERAKNSNLEQVTGVRTQRKRRVNEPTKFDTTDTFLAHIATFPRKNKSDKFLTILEGMKRKDLRSQHQMQLMILRKDGVSKLLTFFRLECLQQTKRYRISVLSL